MVTMAKFNNPNNAGKYPETREGLLALEALDLSDCKLTGSALTCVTHSHFFSHTQAGAADAGLHT